MDFDKILLKAPRLIPMINDAYSVSDASPNVKNRYWYKILKPEMIKLVGFHCDDQELNSPEVYDKVYQFFIKLMCV